MRRLSTILLTTLITFVSCSPTQENQTSFVFPVIIDTTLREHTEKDSKSLEIGDYRPLYIGTKKDTITIIYPRDFLRKYYVYQDSRSKYFRPDSSGLKILVNTSKIISDVTFHWLNGNRASNGSNYKAYPVIIYNTRSDTVSIGYGEHLPLITEALDPEGNWRPIEDRYTYMCGVGLNGIVLPPNEIVITATPVYKGVFKTKLRLRYYNIISDEFDGSINLKQFQPYSGN